MRVIDNEDGTIGYDCFCELQGTDRKADSMGPNRMTLKSIDGVDHCSGFLLDRAATNEYEVFLDAMIDDDTDEIDVDRWSPTAVSKMPTTLGSWSAQGHDRITCSCIGLLIAS